MLTVTFQHDWRRTQKTRSSFRQLQPQPIVQYYNYSCLFYDNPVAWSGREIEWECAVLDNVTSCCNKGGHSEGHQQRQKKVDQYDNTLSYFVMLWFTIIFSSYSSGTSVVVCIVYNCLQPQMPLANAFWCYDVVAVALVSVSSSSVGLFWSTVVVCLCSVCMFVNTIQN